MYVYRAQVIKVVDGDTVWLDVDLGFDVRRKDSFRLYGIDTPELPAPEAVTAMERLTELLAIGPLTVKTVRDRREKYGRYLAVLINGDGTDINQALITEGHARPYTVLSAEDPGNIGA